MAGDSGVCLVEIPGDRTQAGSDFGLIPRDVLRATSPLARY